MFDSSMVWLMVQDFLDISDPFWLQTVYLSLVDLGHFWRFSRLEPRSRDLMRAQMRGGGVSFSVLADGGFRSHRGYSSHHPVEDHDLET